MRKKNILLVILLVFIVGCSTTIKPTYVDPAGRQLPVPHYVLQSTSGEIVFTFYYVALKGNKDLDGTVLSIPTYLSLTSFHKIKLSEYKSINLVIEVMNPKRIEYHMWDKSTSIGEKGYRNFSGTRLSKSNSEYRQYVFQLPLSKKIKQVEYRVEVNDKKGNRMMNIGDFRYKLVK